MNKVMVGVTLAALVGGGLIEAVRLLVGLGWSWPIAIGYGVIALVLAVSARLSRNASGQAGPMS